MSLFQNRPAAVSEQLSPVQRAFPELLMTSDRALPSGLIRDRFQSAEAEYSTAERVASWATAFHNPLVVTGIHGIGKSVLMWQVMQHAAAYENKATVPMMVFAPDISAQNEIEKPSGPDGRNLPYSSFRTVGSVLDRLDQLKGQGYDYGRSLLVIIDGIDPHHHNPSSPGAIRMLNRLREHGVRTILSVDSEQNIYNSGTVLAYQKLLNPSGLATAAILLTRNDQLERTFNKRDITFRN